MNPSKAISDLDFNKIWTATAERDRSTQLSLDVFNGRASFSIFSGQGGPPKVKLALPKQYNVEFRGIFDAVRKGGPDTKIAIPIQTWDVQAKKFNVIASVTFGLDPANLPFIGISAVGHDAVKFPIRTDMSWDISAIPQLNPGAMA